MILVILSLDMYEIYRSRLLKRVFLFKMSNVSEMNLSELEDGSSSFQPTPEEVKLSSTGEVLSEIELIPKKSSSTINRMKTSSTVTNMHNRSGNSKYNENFNQRATSLREFISNERRRLQNQDERIDLSEYNRKQVEALSMSPKCSIRKRLFKFGLL